MYIYISKITKIIDQCQHYTLRSPIGVFLHHDVFDLYIAPSFGIRTLQQITERFPHDGLL